MEKVRPLVRLDRLLVTRDVAKDLNLEWKISKKDLDRDSGMTKVYAKMVPRIIN